jgi:hypothetical protein
VKSTGSSRSDSYSPDIDPSLRCLQSLGLRHFAAVFSPGLFPTARGGLSSDGGLGLARVGDARRAG